MAPVTNDFCRQKTEKLLLTLGMKIMSAAVSHWEYRMFFDRVETLVIGSGIVGLASAIALRRLRPQGRVLVLERGPFPFGASTRNAGFACFGSMTELLDDLGTRSEAEVFGLAARRYAGLQRLRALLGDDNMGFQALGGYEAFRPDDQTTYQQCLEALPYFNAQMQQAIGVEGVYRPAPEVATDFGLGSVNAGILNTAEGQIHTGQTMQSLLRLARELGVEIVNGLEVKALYEGQGGAEVELAGLGTFTFPQVLVCTNGFAQRLMPGLAVFPARNQVLVTRPVPGLQLRGTWHFDRGYVYFRDVEGRVLLGGGRNLDIAGETTDEFGFTDAIQAYQWELLRTLILPQIPADARPEDWIERRWSGIMGLGENTKTPVVERISPHIGVAVRMGGMGVAIGTLVGQEGAEMMITG